MPTLSRFYTRSALIYLGIGFTLGALILSAKAGMGDLRAWAWLRVHIVMLVNGWLIQLSLGVAYWILPRIQQSDRGRSRWAWSSFIVMQTGLVLNAISGVGLWLPELYGCFVPALLLQLCAIGLFAVHAWPRIRPTLPRAKPT
jgi:hypothetical protein